VWSGGELQGQGALLAALARASGASSSGNAVAAASAKGGCARCIPLTRVSPGVRTFSHRVMSV